MRYPVLMVTAVLLVTMTGCNKKVRVFEIHLSEPDFHGLFVISTSKGKEALDLGATNQIVVPASRIVEVKSPDPMQEWHVLEAFDATGRPIPVWKGEHIAGDGLFPLQGNNDEFWYYIGPESELQTLQKCTLDRLEEKLQQQKAEK
jgi:hypothetical protein